MLLPLGLPAATNDLTTALQKGLFEEEANHNLDAAAQAYETVSAQFDKDRKLAATAIFRLGEVYRKQGKTNEATAQYERIVREFSDQQTLATLSRQNLAGLGEKKEALVSSPLTRAARLEQKRLLEEEINLVEQDLAELRKQLEAGVVPQTEVRAKEREALKLRQQVAALNVDADDVAAGTSAGTPITDDEEKEIRRIQEMIKNSPDLINAPRGEGGTPLFQAATKGQLQVAAFLLDHGATVNAPSGSRGTMWDSWTPLIAAASGGHKAMAELLLNHGADLGAKERQGHSPLHLAAKNGFGGVAEVLLAHKANVNVDAKDDSTPLHLAAGAGHSAMMELLLRHGANVNALDKYGQTPLMEAAKSGHGAAVKILIDAKANVNAESGEGRTALSHAGGGNVSVVRLLLEAKADPNAGKVDLPLAMAANYRQLENAELLLRAAAEPDMAGKTSQAVGSPGQPPGGTPPFGPYTPLQIAVSRNDTAMVKLLFTFKVNANAKDPFWSNPPRPLTAWIFGNSEMLAAFLDAGADANANRWEGIPLLASACADANERAVELLLAHGAKTEALSNGRTPLNYAAEKNCLKCVQLLLDAKADANAASPDGVTALHWAVNQGSQEIAESLIAHGAEVNRKDRGGATPLHWAMNLGSRGIGAQKMAELLLSHGADPNLRNNAALTPLDLAKGKSGQPAMAPFVNVTPGIPQTAPPDRRDIATVLREHGAVDDLPDFTSIRVTRVGVAQPTVVFVKDTNALNRFTLLEVIRNWYQSGNDYRGMPFPDFSQIIIHRPVAGKPGAQNEITVNLLTVTNSFDCAKDTSLEFGDVVEIPEREHALSEQPVGMTANQRQELSQCLEGKVTFVVRGQKAELKLDGGSTGWLQLALSGVQNLLRSSSDLSHIKIKRTDPGTKQTREFITDSKSPGPNNLWLRDGDVIEVPDKP